MKARKKKRNLKPSLTKEQVMNMLFDEPPAVNGKNAVIISVVFADPKKG